MGRTVADVRALVLTLARGEVPNPSKGFGPITPAAELVGVLAKDIQPAYEVKQQQREAELMRCAKAWWRLFRVAS